MKSITYFLFAGIMCSGFHFSSSAQTTGNPAPLGTFIDKNGRPTPFPESRTGPSYLDHNKLLQQENNAGVYKQIGVFKVLGSSFLIGQHLKADMFAPEAKAYNVFVNYNTYNQEVEFYSTGNPDKPLIREPGTLDSFIIHKNIEIGITDSLKFIYGSLLGTKDKYYFHEICTGQRFNLYKRYKSQLGYVSTNYVQSELRQFDLEIEYYYTDTKRKGLKKIKSNAAIVINEFKEVKDITSVANVDAFNTNPDDAFKKVFEYLNH